MGQSYLRTYVWRQLSLGRLALHLCSTDLLGIHAQKNACAQAKPTALSLIYWFLMILIPKCLHHSGRLLALMSEGFFICDIWIDLPLVNFPPLIATVIPIAVHYGALRSLPVLDVWFVVLWLDHLMDWEEQIVANEEIQISLTGF